MTAEAENIRALVDHDRQKTLDIFDDEIMSPFAS